MHALKNGVSNQGTNYSVWQVYEESLGVEYQAWYKSMDLFYTTECMLWLTTLMSLVVVWWGYVYDTYLHILASRSCSASRVNLCNRLF